MNGSPWRAAVSGLGVLAIASVATSSGCSSNDGSARNQAGPEAGTIFCAPGTTQRCLGPGACSGAQACLADGSGWTRCDCDAAGAGGMMAGDASVAPQGGGGTRPTANTPDSGGMGGLAGAGGYAGSRIDCIPTPEVCDRIDNDCDGRVDEPHPDADGSGIDYSDPSHCGMCGWSCLLTMTGVENSFCTPPAPNLLGEAPGTCDYDACAPNAYDIDSVRSNGCEYYCPHNPSGSNTVDVGGANGCGIDGDCDGTIDEDVDLCTSVDDCGGCGNRCVAPNATSACVSTAAPGEPCTPDNTGCVIASCHDGYYDRDAAPDNGCEYRCDVSNDGVEICDGVNDEDCDGVVDEGCP